MYLLVIGIFLINCGHVFNYSTINAPANEDAQTDVNYILSYPDRTTALVLLLPHRTFEQRQAINNTFTQLNSGKPLVPDNYVMLSADPFQDLLYAMIAGPTKTFTGYMHSSLEVIQDSSYAPILIEILVVSDSDKKAVIDAYNKNPYYGGFFSEIVSGHTQGDYRNFLGELIRRNREPDPASVDQGDVNLAVQGLGMECHNWNDGRNLIDYVLMSKSKKFAQQVIAQFPGANNGKSLVQAVNENISDPNLRFGYASLIYYISNPLDWVAARIYDSVNENDRHATRILFIISYSEYCLYEINITFQRKYGMSIGQFLQSKNPQDPIDLMLASVADGGIGYY